MAVAKSELETRLLQKSPDFAEWKVDRFATEPVPLVLQRIIKNVEGEFLTWQQWKVKHVWARQIGRVKNTQTAEQQLQEGIRINSAPILTLCFKLQTQVPRAVPKIGTIEGAFATNAECTGEVNVRKILIKPGVRPLNSYARSWTVPTPEAFASCPTIEEVKDKGQIPTDLYILCNGPKISIDPINVSDNAKPETDNTVYLELELMSLYAHYKLQEDNYRGKAERAKTHMAQ